MVGGDLRSALLSLRFCSFFTFSLRNALRLIQGRVRGYPRSSKVTGNEHQVGQVTLRPYSTFLVKSS